MNTRLYKCEYYNTYITPILHHEYKIRVKYITFRYTCNIYHYVFAVTSDVTNTDGWYWGSKINVHVCDMISLR